MVLNNALSTGATRWNPTICDPLLENFEIFNNLQQGSGATITDAFTRYLHQGSGSNTIRVIYDATTCQTNPLTIENNPKSFNRLESVVQEICSTFSLSKEELAEICKINSRKTLYNWINGTASPRKETMSRIFDLLLIVKAWKQSGFQCSQQELYQPILNGQSLFELLKQAKLDKELILFVGSRLNMILPSKGIIPDPFD